MMTKLLVLLSLTVVFNALSMDEKNRIDMLIGAD